MFFFWVALAMADFNNLMMTVAAAFFVKDRMFKASSDPLPRTKSATNLAFLGANLANLNFAFTSILCSLRFDFGLSVSGMAMEGSGW